MQMLKLVYGTTIMYKQFDDQHVATRRTVYFLFLEAPALL